MMKRIVILGSTGSIGVNTLEVAKMLGEEVEVVGLSANKNVAGLAEQVREHKPRAVAIAGDHHYELMVIIQPVIVR